MSTAGKDGAGALTEESFNLLAYCWLAIALVLFPIQFFVAPPYGRHVRRGWGPVMPNRMGWIVMELVAPVVFAFALLSGGIPNAAAVWFISVLWFLHYIQRTFFYAVRMRTSNKTIPIAIVCAVIVFNYVNGWLNGYYLGQPWRTYSEDWFAQPHVVLGTSMFFAGMALNIWADNKLIALRKTKGSTDYAIPRGGAFEYVSCPNHLGETVEWIGFAILCWNLPAAVFAIWTATNLIPRALAHDRWYRTRFPDYPEDRKAIVPLVL